MAGTHLRLGVLTFSGSTDYAFRAPPPLGVWTKNVRRFLGKINQPTGGAMASEVAAFC